MIPEEHRDGVYFREKEEKQTLFPAKICENAQIK